ncbi:hypothetical protein PsYK624_041870 [Phanerochaete sordida]|uniref:Uncharacterized protein n=1 Tax=Phanerochaete sordida TaxID=48140 RepID=A0A9P3LB19_9APHY|nr:hypothetical protein PsYK624_041870 [Phanerochaete sordida]
MFRRLLLVLPIISALLSVDSRPTLTKHDEHRLDPRREAFAPVLVPVGEPAMLLGRHYQVVKRDPSPLNLPPSLSSQLAQAKGEAPPVPTAPTMPGKRSTIPMPRYIYERNTHDTNYLSNVGPPPGPYPGYTPYEGPKPPPPPPPASSTKGALDGAETRSADDKKGDAGDGGGERKAMATATAKAATSKTVKNKQTKHKSE